MNEQVEIALGGHGMEQNTAPLNGGMIGAIMSLLALPFSWVFKEPPAQAHIDDISKAMENRYEQKFGEPWSALEARVLAKHPEYKKFLE